MATDDAPAPLITSDDAAALEHLTAILGDAELAQHIAADARRQMIGTSAAGRPRFTPAKRAVFLAALARGASIKRACECAQITSQTQQLARQKSPAFAAAVELALDAAADDLEDVLDGKARAGEIAAIIFSLKGRRPDKWRDGPSVQINQQFNITGRLETARQRLKHR